MKLLQILFPDFLSHPFKPGSFLFVAAVLCALVLCVHHTGHSEISHTQRGGKYAGTK